MAIGGRLDEPTCPAQFYSSVCCASSGSVTPHSTALKHTWLISMQGIRISPLFSLSPSLSLHCLLLFHPSPNITCFHLPLYLLLLFGFLSSFRSFSDMPLGRISLFNFCLCSPVVWCLVKKKPNFCFVPVSLFSCRVVCRQTFNHSHSVGVP